MRFYAGVPLKTQSGHNIGTLCIADIKPRTFTVEQIQMLEDFACIAMSEFDLRKLATTDGLTGVLTRRAFKEGSARALGLAVRHRHEASCIAFDLDHFKAINDAHGHAAGDKVLVECANICRKQLRKTDLFGRLGGEEFAILLPHTALAAALKVAEKLRKAMTSHKFHGPSEPIRFAASFGVASLAHSVVDIETLLSRADAALYEAKSQGRNRCAQWAIARQRSKFDAAGFQGWPDSIQQRTLDSRLHRARPLRPGSKSFGYQHGGPAWPIQAPRSNQMTSPGPAVSWRRKIKASRWNSRSAAACGVTQDRTSLAAKPAFRPVP